MCTSPNPQFGLILSSSGPLSASQDCDLGLQRARCCRLSSVLGNLSWTGPQFAHTLHSSDTGPCGGRAGVGGGITTFTKVWKPKRFPGDRGGQVRPDTQKSLTPPVRLEAATQTPRCCGDLSPAFWSPMLPPGDAETLRWKAILPGSQPAGDAGARGSGRRTGQLAGSRQGWVFRGYRLPESRFPAPTGGRKALAALGRETRGWVGWIWETEGGKGEPEEAPRRWGEGRGPRARLPTVTHTDLGAATCASWGRRCALWRRYPPGCRCRARGSCWGCSASCWQTAGPSAAPAPAASGGSSRWLWPRPWWPGEWVPGGRGRREGEPGTREREGAAQTAARPRGRVGRRPEGVRRGVGALSPD